MTRPALDRSFGPVRALLYGGADHPTHANHTIVSFAMIETAKALDNLDDILSAQGLDAIYIGPSDLSLALGCTPTFDDLDPTAAQAVEHILARAKAHGVVAAARSSPTSSTRRRHGGQQDKADRRRRPGCSGRLQGRPRRQPVVRLGQQRRAAG